MEKYLYFRADATVGNDDDETAGSKVYPVSAFRGMVSGTSTALGAVTDDADAFSMYFTPMGKTLSAEDEAASDNVDVVVVAITTDNNQKAVMASVVSAMNSTAPHDGFVEIFDAVTGNSCDADIEGLTVIHTQAAD